jgi:hypothetical protein
MLRLPVRLNLLEILKFFLFAYEADSAFEVGPSLQAI